MTRTDDVVIAFRIEGFSGDVGGITLVVTSVDQLLLRLFPTLFLAFAEKRYVDPGFRPVIMT
jgi:hypothetical protein